MIYKVISFHTKAGELSPALSDFNVVAQLHLKSGASSFSVASQPLRDTAKTARKTIF
ncbi:MULTISPECIES: hypothetical protein [unclassified Enterococcus]|uniref:hypothetical protein n=1 Tax=unclassified Enterococcus TaxID=2608891 RepID=UPI00159F6F89|nr:MULTISPECIES: hypothetical protein [unclassified Enterococcus]